MSVVLVQDSYMNVLKIILKKRSWNLLLKAKYLVKAMPDATQNFRIAYCS